MIVTSSIGMAHHAKLYARTYGFDYVPVEKSREFKDIYQFGIYEYEDYENIKSRKEGRVILHWCGSDIFSFSRRVRLNKFTADFGSNVLHFTHSSKQRALIKELLGIDTTAMTRFNDDRNKYQVTDLPTKFTPLVYYDTSRAKQFGLKEIMSVIKQSTFDFILLGKKDQWEDRKNIKWIEPISLLEESEKYIELLKSCSCLLRFDKQGTEGFSQMVMQMFLLGRRVISNTVIPFVTITEPSIERIARSLYQVSQLTTSVADAATYYREMPIFDLKEYMH